MSPIVVTALVMCVLTIALYLISSFAREGDAPPTYPSYVFAVECFLATALFVYVGMLDGNLPSEWYTWIFFAVILVALWLGCCGFMIAFGLYICHLILVPIYFIKLFILEWALGYKITVTKLEPYFDSRYTAYKVKWAVITALNVISFVVLSIPIIQRLIE